MLTFTTAIQSGLAESRHGFMRAAVIVRPGEVEMRHEPLPIPSEGELRVRVEGCGVCASNLAVWAGAPWFNYPLEPGAPGHEAFGRVDLAGSGVTGWERGQRVAFLSSHGFAEFDLARSDSSVILPAELDGVPFLGEPLGCAMNIFKRSNIREGDTVAVIGIGFLGALLVQLCVRAGARVIALARSMEALRLTESFGATGRISLEEPPAAIGMIRELTGGRFCDVTIEATGKQGPLDIAGEITRERGRLVIAGYHQDGPRLVNMQLWNWRGLDVINAHERDTSVYVSGIRAGVIAVGAGELDVSPLLTHRFPLEELGAALDMARDRPAGFMKALIIP